MEAKGLRLNSNKTMIFINRPNLNTQTQARSPVVVLEGGVGSTFVFCTSCSQWIHRKCNWLIGKFEASLDYNVVDVLVSPAFLIVGSAQNGFFTSN